MARELTIIAMTLSLAIGSVRAQQPNTSAPPANSNHSAAYQANRTAPDDRESKVLSDVVVLLLGTLLSL